MVFQQAEQGSAALVTSLDPVQVKADFHAARADDLERAVDLAVRALHHIIYLYESEEANEPTMQKMAGTAGRARAAMGAAK